jgi:hypothetical protein
MLVLLHNWATEKPRTSETEREITLPTPAEELMTFWYANGVFAADGRIEKTWNPPGPGSTNSVFIWPETMRFFRKIFPQAFPPSEEDQVANRLPVTD